MPGGRFGRRFFRRVLLTQDRLRIRLCRNLCRSEFGSGAIDEPWFDATQHLVILIKGLDVRSHNFDATRTQHKEEEKPSAYDDYWDVEGGAEDDSQA